MKRSRLGRWLRTRLKTTRQRRRAHTAPSELVIETLEPRCLLAADPLLLPTITFSVSVGDTVGQIEMETLPHQVPKTVENFANYIEDGDFIHSIIHRLDKTPGRQVIQGGLLTSPVQAFTGASQFDVVDMDPPIPNEPDADQRPNVRGAVGMARTGDPDSATSQFYLNTQDNPTFDQPLHPVGYTVFANVTDMTTVDLITTLPVLPEQPLGLETVPYAEVDGGAARNLVRIESIAATGTVHGVKFNDRDGDGDRDDGEEGIAGATIYADLDDNGVLDGDDVVAETDSDGRYALRLNLPDADAAQFVIREQEDPRFDVTSPAGGSQQVIVRPGLDTDNVDFGNQIRPVVEIEATDPNASETGPEAGTFRIYVANTEVATIPTSFEVLFAVGGTAVNFEDYNLVDNFVRLTDQDTSATIDITPLSDEQPEAAETVTLTVTRFLSTYVVGDNGSATVTITDEPATSSLAGFVYFDLNENGEKDDDDLPIGGVTMRLDGPAGFVATQVTAADGSYAFDNLIPGAYQISEDPDQDLRVFCYDGDDTVGSQGGTVDSELDQITVPDLRADVQGDGNNFGELGRRSEFYTKRDFLASTPEEDVLAAVDARTGQTLWYALGDGWEDFISAQFRFSEDRTQITLTVVDTNETEYKATVEIADAHHVYRMGYIDEKYLIGFMGQPEDFDFEPVEPEGPAPVQAVQDQPQTTAPSVPPLSPASGEALMTVARLPRMVADESEQPAVKQQPAGSAVELHDAALAALAAIPLRPPAVPFAQPGLPAAPPSPEVPYPSMRDTIISSVFDDEPEEIFTQLISGPVAVPSYADEDPDAGEQEDEAEPEGKAIAEVAEETPQLVDRADADPSEPNEGDATDEPTDATVDRHQSLPS
jgi:peptidyl-prolyl cis-trans isomerase A (cyclophilin A)